MRRLIPFAKAIIPQRYHESVRRWIVKCGGVHWCRVVMNREVDGFLASLPHAQLDVLEISGNRLRDYPFRSYKIVQYPDYDVCGGPLAEQFDVIVVEQVLEHVLRPDLAVANVYNMLRPGGVFVVTTPFLLKVHGYPSDLYRWTEHGLRQLLETAGFAVTTTGSWGNRKCLIADLHDGTDWMVYIPGLHSLRNEPQFAIMVWAFARKPGGN